MQNGDDALMHRDHAEGSEPSKAQQEQQDWSKRRNNTTATCRFLNPLSITPRRERDPAVKAGGEALDWERDTEEEKDVSGY